MLLPATVTALPRFLPTAFPLFISVAAWWPRKDRMAWDMMLVLSGAGLAGLTALYGVLGAIPSRSVAPPRDQQHRLPTMSDRHL